jgi:hypothetical protein
MLRFCVNLKPLGKFKTQLGKFTTGRLKSCPNVNDVDVFVEVNPLQGKLSTSRQNMQPNVNDIIVLGKLLTFWLKH